MKRWEYRNIHLLLAPVYLRMIGWCLRYRVTPFGLLKADYALDHGGAFASKYEIQMVFPQQRFPPTVLLREDHSQAERMQTLRQFGSDHGYPIILKPDLGRVGMGVALVHDEAATRCFLDEVKASYIAQEFVPGPLEFGVFYVRRNGVPDLFSINSKDFPAVTGDGCDSVSQLIERDPRLSSFGKLFNQTNFHRIPSRGETVQLSIVGSHTLGCIFRDASALKTRPLIEAIHESAGVSGFNYGRLDVRTVSIEALQRGEFIIIEVNGVESLATNAFDPTFSYRDGLAWFTRQYRLLVEIAAEHREAEMERLPLRDFIREVLRAEETIHQIGSLLHFSSARVDSHAAIDKRFVDPQQ